MNHSPPHFILIKNFYSEFKKHYGNIECFDRKYKNIHYNDISLTLALNFADMFTNEIKIEKNTNRLLGWSKLNLHPDVSKSLENLAIELKKGYVLLPKISLGTYIMDNNIPTIEDFTVIFPDPNKKKYNYEIKSLLTSHFCKSIPEYYDICSKYVNDITEQIYKSFDQDVKVYYKGSMVIRQIFKHFSTDKSDKFINQYYNYSDADFCIKSTSTNCITEKLFLKQMEVLFADQKLQINIEFAKVLLRKLLGCASIEIDSSKYSILPSRDRNLWAMSTPNIVGIKYEKDKNFIRFSRNSIDTGIAKFTLIRQMMSVNLVNGSNYFLKEFKIEAIDVSLSPKDNNESVLQNYLEKY